MSGSDILARLMELDQKAGELVEEAQEELDNTLSGIERETEAFRQEAIRKAGAARDEEAKAGKAQLEDIAERYQALAREMEKTYEEKHSQWEEEIFRRCVGK